MGLIFDPAKIVEKLAPKTKIANAVSSRVSVKKAALRFLDNAPIDASQALDVALKTVKDYQLRLARAQADAGLSKAAGKKAKAEILDDPKQLINRVQGNIVFQLHEGIKKNYAGERAIWLPSDADEPRPEHQLNYGKEYTIGEGIDGVEPGDEYGCRCGVEILTDDKQINFE